MEAGVNWKPASSQEISSSDGYLSLLGITATELAILALASSPSGSLTIDQICMYARNMFPEVSSQSNRDALRERVLHALRMHNQKLFLAAYNQSGFISHYNLSPDLHGKIAEVLKEKCLLFAIRIVLGRGIPGNVASHSNTSASTPYYLRPRLPCLILHEIIFNSNIQRPPSEQIQSAAMGERQRVNSLKGQDIEHWKNQARLANGGDTRNGDQIPGTSHDQAQDCAVVIVSWAEMAILAIKSSLSGFLDITNIYNFIENFFPDQCHQDTWKNTVRHAVLNGKIFVRDEALVGRNVLYSITPEFSQKLDVELSHGRCLLAAIRNVRSNYNNVGMDKFSTNDPSLPYYLRSNMPTITLDEAAYDPPPRPAAVAPVDLDWLAQQLQQSGGAPPAPTQPPVLAAQPAVTQTKTSVNREQEVPPPSAGLLMTGTQPRESPHLLNHPATAAGAFAMNQLLKGMPDTTAVSSSVPTNAAAHPVPKRLEKVIELDEDGPSTSSATVRQRAILAVTRRRDEAQSPEYLELPPTPSPTVIADPATPPVPPPAPTAVAGERLDLAKWLKASAAASDSIPPLISSSLTAPPATAHPSTSNLDAVAAALKIDLSKIDKVAFEAIWEEFLREKYPQLQQQQQGGQIQAKREPSSPTEVVAESAMAEAESAAEVAEPVDEGVADAQQPPLEDARLEIKQDPPSQDEMSAAPVRAAISAETDDVDEEEEDDNDDDPDYTGEEEEQSDGEEQSERSFIVHSDEDEEDGDYEDDSDQEKVEENQENEEGEKADEEPEYEVETILDRRTTRDGRLEYLIKWLDFDGEPTWEDEENTASCPAKIAEFERARKIANRRNIQRKLTKRDQPCTSSAAFRIAYDDDIFENDVEPDEGAPREESVTPATRPPTPLLFDNRIGKAEPVDERSNAESTRTNENQTSKLNVKREPTEPSTSAVRPLETPENMNLENQEVPDDGAPREKSATPTASPPTPLFDNRVSEEEPAEEQLRTESVASSTRRRSVVGNETEAAVEESQVPPREESAGPSTRLRSLIVIKSEVDAQPPVVSTSRTEKKNDEQAGEMEEEDEEEPEKSDGPSTRLRSLINTKYEAAEQPPVASTERTEKKNDEQTGEITASEENDGEEPPREETAGPSTRLRSSIGTAADTVHRETLEDNQKPPREESAGPSTRLRSTTGVGLDAESSQNDEQQQPREDSPGPSTRLRSSIGSGTNDVSRETVEEDQKPPREEPAGPSTRRRSLRGKSTEPVHQQPVASTSRDEMAGDESGETAPDQMAKGKAKEPEWIVEKILDKRTWKGRLQYFIQWEGFKGQDSWEDESNCEGCPVLILEYEERVKNGGLKRKHVETPSKSSSPVRKKHRVSTVKEEIHEQPEAASTSSSPVRKKRRTMTVKEEIDQEVSADISEARPLRRSGRGVVKIEMMNEEQEENADVAFWSGKTKSAECPRCKKKIDAGRRAHYKMHHYDIFFAVVAAGMGEIERWVSQRVGGAGSGQLKDLRVCLHCKKDSHVMHDGKIAVLRHIKKEHNSEFRSLQQDYRKYTRTRTKSTLNKEEMAVDRILN